MNLRRKARSAVGSRSVRRSQTKGKHPKKARARVFVAKKYKELMARETEAKQPIKKAA